MKQARITLAALAVICGVGGAFTVKAYFQPPVANVRNTAAAGATPSWTPIVGAPGSCNQASSRACTGYNNGTTVQILTTGNNYQ